MNIGKKKINGRIVKRGEGGIKAALELALNEMKWIEIKDARNIKHMINLNNIVDIIYHEDTDLTEMIYIRSAFASVYVRGNIIPQLRKILPDTQRIGE